MFCWESRDREGKNERRIDVVAATDDVAPAADNSAASGADPGTPLLLLLLPFIAATN